MGASYAFVAAAQPQQTPEPPGYFANYGSMNDPVGAWNKADSQGREKVKRTLEGGGDQALEMLKSLWQCKLYPQENLNTIYQDLVESIMRPACTSTIFGGLVEFGSADGDPVFQAAKHRQLSWPSPS